MLKRLLRPLLEPLASKLDKLLGRTTEGFKKQQDAQAESRKKLSERLNQLSRQVDESRDEVIRGFARQEAKMNNLKKQLDEVLLRMAKLSALSGGRPGVAPQGATEGSLSPQSSGERAPIPSQEDEVNPLAAMMLDAGGTWLASQRKDEGKA